MNDYLPAKHCSRWHWMKTRSAVLLFLPLQFYFCQSWAVHRHSSVERFCKISRPNCRRSTRRKSDDKLHSCSGKYMLLQAPCGCNEILEYIYVILWIICNFAIALTHKKYPNPYSPIRPLLCLASNEFATSNQIEYACAALSNMAAIEDNQSPLCKAGAISVLSAIEIELENDMAACENFKTTLYWCLILFQNQIMHTTLCKIFQETFLETCAGA